MDKESKTQNQKDKEKMLRLTRNFMLSEFTKSDTAVRRRIDNTPKGIHLENIKSLALKLEDVRFILDNNPIIISSGYRSPELNRAVGGVPSSSHAMGLAADFTCPGFGSVEEVCRAISESNLPFDQLIFEQGYNDWVHLGFGPRMRREVLSWKSGKGYVKGVQRL